MSERDLRARLLDSLDAEPAELADSIRLRLAAIELLGQRAGSAPELRLPADLVRARLAAGTPLLDGIDLSVSADSGQLFERLSGLFLADPAQEGAVTGILTAVQRHQLHAEQVVGEAAVSHDDHLSVLAEAAGVNGNLLVLLADLTSRPLLAGVAARLQRALRLVAWEQPFCPICGARPIFGERREEAFGLRCGRCATRWAWSLLPCPSCERGSLSSTALTDAHGQVSTAVLTCTSCDTYLKLATEDDDVQSLTAVLLFDLATWTVDRAALLHGLQAPTWRPRRLEHGEPAGEDLDDD